MLLTQKAQRDQERAKTGKRNLCLTLAAVTAPMRKMSPRDPEENAAP
eukprot:CAMPEP_0174341320 /NCGR_PEP_ID=MMETSP0810-20121108/25341_1 /TAXON_ID=73025 ORGANISM="Eutreptiella gymnastica-like, Strain CCMP1594" /NCGR_SAMPLE_ID=MMETSP0810 /ASSEMBLY_ACC=CAM_ASM_000659 /LENGTH=46 /DNA_ID= /DNA_START= /DNA_END= /DNA_ORIENTATION=